jgi:branched-chain amino acid transport system permease protein
MLNRALVALADATGLPITLGIITGIEFMVFGTLMIIFLVFEPHGLAKIYQNFKNYFRLWPFSY